MATGPSARRNATSCARSSSSGRTFITSIEPARPSSRIEPRSTYLTPSTLPARCATSRLVRISAGPARPESRAARLSAPPRKVSFTLTASPASRPIPTANGSIGLAIVSSTNASCRSIAARIACRAESKTASASAPRSATMEPPPRSTWARASSANVVASRAAASSPRLSVKAANPRTSAIKNVLMPPDFSSSGVPTGGEIRLDPIFEADKANLSETGDLGLGEALERELAEGRPAPERERLGMPALYVQALEALEVELSLLDSQQIAGGLRLQTVLSKLLAQLGDVHLERLAGRSRRILVPECIGQAVRGDDMVCVEQEDGQECSLFVRAELYRSPVRENLQRAEYPVVHSESDITVRRPAQDTVTLTPWSPSRPLLTVWRSGVRPLWREPADDYRGMTARASDRTSARPDPGRSRRGRTRVARLCKTRRRAAITDTREAALLRGTP